VQPLSEKALICCCPLSGKPEKFMWLLRTRSKAVEGEQQLAAYDRHLLQLDGEVKKVFLTLTGEPPRADTGWKPVSYSVLQQALFAQPASDSPPFDDLCDALTRLVAVGDEARLKPDTRCRGLKDKDALDVTDIKH
jgi:hypothetical protein